MHNIRIGIVKSLCLGFIIKNNQVINTGLLVMGIKFYKRKKIRG